MKKRILSLLLTLVMILIMIPPMSANALTYEIADEVIVNNISLGNGRVNMGDVSKLYAHINGTNMLTGVTLFMADISDDGRINMGDVSKLYAHIKGTNLLAWDT